jgi:Protein of unknown function (DUF2569)
MPSGIAGWLILPALFTFASAVYMALSVYAIPMAILYDDREYSEFVLEGLLFPLLAIGWIISCFLLLQKKRSFPKLYVALSGVLFLYGLYALYLLFEGELSVAYTWWETPYLLNALLIPYTLFSKRVKNTFVN